MQNPIMVLFFVAFLVIPKQGYACSCPSQSIDREVETAHDIVVGKVISEKNQWVSCMYPEGDKEYDLTTSYTYTLQTNFSFKGKFDGIQVIQGGKGKGDCGAIFEVGKEYVIVVQKCDKGFYSTLCSDNTVLAEASSQVMFLNTYFGKNYKIESGSVSGMLKFLILVAVLVLMLIMFGIYTSHTKRKSIV